MSWDYEPTREFTDDIVDMHTQQAQPGEWIGNVIGFCLVFGLLLAIVYGLFLDCGGQAC
jgi:hypothetical protein